MSREIKFRAWLKDDKTMEFVDIIDWNFESISFSKLIPIKESNPEYDEIEVRFDEVELMQFSGVKDRNGKEIYEGDIVKFAVFDLTFDADENVKKFEKRYEKDEVIFTNGRFIAGIKYGSNESLALMQELEVVGNIYENPELLEK